jgi:predicted anti-sigma-YlaC factor YlaD
MGVFRQLSLGSCADTGEHLSDRLDGELRRLRAWRVARHLARCEHCRAALASLERVVEQLRALRPVELPPSTAPWTRSSSASAASHVRRRSA